MTILTIVAGGIMLMLLLAYADRRVGTGGEHILGPLGGRSIGFITGGLGSALIGYLIAGLPLLIMGLAWPIYRSLDFKHGAMAPKNNKERVNALLRHLTVLLLGVPLYFVVPTYVPGIMILLTMFALFAWGAAILLGYRLLETIASGSEWDDKHQIVTERARGAMYGLCMFCVALMIYILEKV